MVGGVWEVDRVAISSEVVSGMGYWKDVDMIFVSRQSCLLKGLIGGMRTNGKLDWYPSMAFKFTPTNSSNNLLRWYKLIGVLKLSLWRWVGPARQIDAPLSGKIFILRSVFLSCLDGDNDKVAGISEIWSFEFTVKSQHSGGR